LECGDIVVEDACPALIDKETFNRVQERLDLEAVFIGGNAELVRQFFANRGGSDDACQKGKLGGANEEWRKTAVPRRR